VFVHSIMDLPENTVFIILRKLASQDPFALLEAACVCKSFHTVTTQNPGLWKVAFYGAVLPLNEKPRDKALEAEVESFGGFKKLVKARWGKRTSGGRYSGSLSNGKDLHIGEPLSKSDSLILLTLLRTSDRRLLLWGAQEAFKSSSDVPKSIIDGLPLCPVTMTKSSDLAEICQPYFINGPAVAPVPHSPPEWNCTFGSKLRIEPRWHLFSGNAYCHYPNQTRTSCSSATLCYSLANQKLVAPFKSTGRARYSLCFNVHLEISRKLSFYQRYVSPLIQQLASVHLISIVQA
jgi:hypothetical protein